MTETLTGMTTLGTVNNEDHSKDSGLFQQPLPASDSTQSILLDLFGCSHIINIDGTYTGSASDTKTFVGQLRGLLTGSQTSRSYYSVKDDYTYKVLVQNATWKHEEGSPGKVNYSISLVEGNV